MEQKQQQQQKAETFWNLVVFQKLLHTGGSRKQWGAVNTKKPEDSQETNFSTS